MRKILLLFVLALFFAGACARQQQEEVVGKGMPVPGQENVPESVVEGKVVDSTPNAPSGAVKEFRMTAKQFVFEPAAIEVNKGDTVRLIVTSTDVPHGINIPEYGINERLDVGKPVTIEFVADKQGTFTSYCSVFCGSGHSNMKGTIVVR